MIKKASQREKGKRLEREVADLLTGLTGVSFRRTPSSGAYFTMRGDVMKIGQEVSSMDTFIIECKNTKRLVIPEWIKQVKGEMIDSNKKRFILVFNIRGEKYFMTNESGFCFLLKKS